MELNHKPKQLDGDSLWLVSETLLKERSFTESTVESMNEFLDIGVSQILTSVFKIDKTIPNKRQQKATTAEEKAIKNIRLKVDFTNVKVLKPQIVSPNGGKKEEFYPSQAHIYDKSYSGDIIADVKIEAIAYLENGQQRNKQYERKEFHLAKIPIMVGTRWCNTEGKGKATLAHFGCEPDAVPGYVTRSGKEWFINMVESINFNQARIFNNNYQNEYTRVEFVSKPGVRFENSSEIIIRYLRNGCLTVQIVRGIIKEVQFPFYLLFRALGMASDEDVFKHIVGRRLGTPKSDTIDYDPGSIEEKIIDMVNRAMLADYDTKSLHFGRYPSVRTASDTLVYLARRIPVKEFEELDYSKADQTQRALQMLQELLDNLLLPHIGTGKGDRLTKLRFLGHLINKMLYTNLGIIDETDRDSYTTKRIHTPGVAVSKVFKTYVNMAVIGPVNKEFTRAFTAQDFDAVTLETILQQSATKFAALEQLIMKSITSGNQAAIEISTNRTIKNRLSTQLWDRKNFWSLYSIARMIIATQGETTTGSVRAHAMRMPHPSSQGFVDPVQSPDGGSKVGLHKQLCISAFVTSYSMPDILEEKLAERKLFYPLERIQPYDVVESKRVYEIAKIFINGKWIGYAIDSLNFVRTCRDLRRDGIIDKNISIEWDMRMNEVYLWCDSGRIQRPLIIVYNNIRDYKVFGLKAPASPDNFKQTTGWTPNIVNALKTGKLTFTDLIKMKIVEYICADEQARMFLADTYADFLLDVDNPLRQYTHVDIPENTFGMMTLSCPLAHNSMTTRNTFQTSHVKQTGSQYTSAIHSRTDKNRFYQYQTDWPLVHTIINNYVKPNGCNTIVAVACYGGNNIEDSINLSQAYAETRHGGMWLDLDKIYVEKGEQVGVPNFTETTGKSVYANYSKLNPATGIVKVGTALRRNDVVVGKVKALTRTMQKEMDKKYADTSLIYERKYPSVVHAVVTGRDSDDKEFVKIGYRSLRTPERGDKFSSREGQKGVCGWVVPQIDMPFMECGTKPDIIFNPHSFPKRMTVNYLIELFLGLLCASYGVSIDGSVFRYVDKEMVGKMLESVGLDYYGRHRLYNGFTGEWIDGLIFMGPMYYQRLQRFAISYLYAMNVGPTDIITRQPLEGTKNKGSMRISELQRDVLFAHGCARFLSEKFYDDSDGMEIHVCRCGAKAIVNIDKEIFRCPNCKNDAEINSVFTACSSQLFDREKACLNIHSTFELNPIEFYE